MQVTSPGACPQKASSLSNSVDFPMVDMRCSSQTHPLLLGRCMTMHATPCTRCRRLSVHMTWFAVRCRDVRPCSQIGEAALLETE